MQDTQDELDYQQLIARVALFDKNAAYYMQNAMREIDGFTACGDIWAVVAWGDTAQGFEFWSDLVYELDANE